MTAALYLCAIFALATLAGVAGRRRLAGLLADCDEPAIMALFLSAAALAALPALTLP